MPRSSEEGFCLPFLELGDGRRLELHAVVGTGSASTVYRAIVASPYGVRRAVAAKIFSAIASDDLEHVVSAVAHAAQQAAWIHHPNVVGTHELLRWGSTPILLMDLVEGISLAALLERYAARQRRLPLDIALFIAAEIAEALSGARTATAQGGIQLGVLHLGLTPREVLLSWLGEVKVEGFGLEMARSGTSTVRSMRAVAGRATTMAPEVARGDAGDARADVFSLGVITRELLVGPRFPRGTTSAQALRLAREGYVQPICFQPHLPDDLVRVMLRALDVDPDRRFPNATAMAYELRRVAFGMGVGDARYFLRRALVAELGGDDQDITRERPFSGS